MISGIKMTCGSVREKFEIVAGYERLIRKKDFKDLFQNLKKKFVEVEKVQKTLEDVFEEIKGQANGRSKQ